jgi:alpha-L-fucosidase 2
MVGVVNLTPSEGEQSCRWDWRAGEAVSSRTPIRNAVQQAQYQKSYGHPVKLWVDNPAAERSQSEGVDLCVQKLLARGAYATAWKETQSSGQGRTVFASCVMSWPGLESSQDSVSEVRSASAAGFQSLRDSNRLWWHTYYPASFLSIPDTQLESFYWIQMYKYGCAAPKQPGIIDTHGPWLQPTNWPYITWNLNTQISYWALQPANRLKLADSLFRSLDAHPRVMSQNVAGFTTGDDLAALGHCSQQDLLAPFDADVRFEREWGNLLWVCHNYWLQYRFTMDDALLRHRLFPLLRRAVNFYLPHLEEGSDGKLHLPITFSPEIGSTRDCNYDLALLRWACQTLLTISARLHVEDARAIRWREVVSRLTSYPVDEHGLRIGADLSAAPHRHFSHLLMIYPLYLMNWDEPSSRELIKKSVEYWYSATRTGKSDAGFTLAVGSSFYASMQRGDDALACLDGLLNGPTGMGKIMSNTMYAESGQNMETPLAAAQAYHDMLLQSWGDRIRVFPAVPAKWKYLVFHNLRAQGAFLVSASMKDGRASWVRVKSLSGERCIIQCAFGAKPVAFRQRGTIDLRVLNPDSYEVRLRRGEEVLLHAPSFSGRPVVSPVPAQPHRSNYYGLHQRQT